MLPFQIGRLADFLWLDALGFWRFDFCRGISIPAIQSASGFWWYMVYPCGV
jgi:hypothetical protein